MRIEKDVVPKPCEDSIMPYINFDIQLVRTKYQEALVGVAGWLKTDDGKTIAALSEIAGEGTKVEELGARGSNLDSNFREEPYNVTLTALLDRVALDYIERRRFADRKLDVKLALHINVKYVDTRAKIWSNFSEDPTTIGLHEVLVNTSHGRVKGSIVVDAYDPGFSPSSTNRWIISGNSGPVFLFISQQTFKKDVRIPSTDWINDYSPKLGLGEFFVVQIPKGDKILEDAWNLIQKAEEAFRRWDTKGVYANCREVGYLLDRVLREKVGKRWVQS